MTSYTFSWILAALGFVAIALLFAGERGVVADAVLGVIGGIGGVAPLAWYIAHGYFDRKRKG